MSNNDYEFTSMLAPQASGSRVRVCRKNTLRTLHSLGGSALGPSTARIPLTHIMYPDRVSRPSTTNTHHWSFIFSPNLKNKPQIRSRTKAMTKQKLWCWSADFFEGAGEYISPFPLLLPRGHRPDFFGFRRSYLVTGSLPDVLVHNAHGGRLSTRKRQKKQTQQKERQNEQARTRSCERTIAPSRIEGTPPETPHPQRKRRCMQLCDVDPSSDKFVILIPDKVLLGETNGTLANHTIKMAGKKRKVATST